MSIKWSKYQLTIYDWQYFSLNLLGEEDVHDGIAKFVMKLVNLK